LLRASESVGKSLNKRIRLLASWLETIQLRKDSPASARRETASGIIYFPW